MFSLLARSLSIAALALLFAGCTSMGEMVGQNTAEDLHSRPVFYPERTYAASLDEVKQAALFSLGEAGLINISEGQTADGIWFAIGEVGYSWRSNGQFVRISAKPDSSSDSPRTEVYYTSIKRFEVNVTEDLLAVQEKLLNLMDVYIESQ